jgi:hypothetical protein
MDRLNISNEADRLAVATILIKNDYVVTQGKEKNGNKIIKYLEYEEKDYGRKRD